MGGGNDGGGGSAATCGNGVLDPGEICDTAGNTMTCDSDCTAVECGDATINTAAGEECDSAGESAECDSDCTLAVCGDAVVNASAAETCDEAGDSATCDADCTVAECGDGYANAAAGEECDDGDSNDKNACSNGCLADAAYGDCVVNSDCLIEDEVCLQGGSGVNVCSVQGCLVATDCPPAPMGVTAVVLCSQMAGNLGGPLDCHMACNTNADCPAGMFCFDGFAKHCAYP
jgi:hypothetical protein